jgi:hypothetical protein
MKIQTDFKFIWLILSKDQVLKAFIIMDKLEEINLLKCLIMAQQVKIKNVMDQVLHLKSN